MYRFQQLGTTVLWIQVYIYIETLFEYFPHRLHVGWLRRCYWFRRGWGLSLKVRFRMRKWRNCRCRIVIKQDSTTSYLSYSFRTQAAHTREHRMSQCLYHFCTPRSGLQAFVRFLSNRHYLDVSSKKKCNILCLQPDAAQLGKILHETGAISI